MTFVVTENCIQCRYTDCVDACPVDAFHEGPNFLVINPEACICCNLCVAECPAQAIFADDELPAGMEHFEALNRELSQTWPVISRSLPPLPDAKAWDGKRGKIAFLQL